MYALFKIYAQNVSKAGSVIITTTHLKNYFVLRDARDQFQLYQISLHTYSLKLYSSTAHHAAKDTHLKVSYPKQTAESPPVPTHNFGTLDYSHFFPHHLNPRLIRN